MEHQHGKTNIVDYLDHSFFEWRDENGFSKDLLIRMKLLKSLRLEMRAGRQYNDSAILKIDWDVSLTGFKQTFPCSRCAGLLMGIPPLF